MDADSVMSSLVKGDDAEVDATMDSIREILENNRPLMFLLAGMLRNKEWVAVLENSLQMTPAAASQLAAAEASKKKVWMLRTGLTLMEHLKRRTLYS